MQQMSMGMGLRTALFDMVPAKENGPFPIDLVFKGYEHKVDFSSTERRKKRRQRNEAKRARRKHG